MRAIYCANNNKVYKSLAAAARDLNIDSRSICEVAKGRRLHAVYYLVSYIVEEDDPAEERNRLLYNAFKIKM